MYSEEHIYLGDGCWLVLVGLLQLLVLLFVQNFTRTVEITM
jgi:hypothetical protein